MTRRRAEFSAMLVFFATLTPAHAQRPPPTSPIPTSAILPPAFDRAMQDRIERAQLFTQIPIDLEWGLP